jgi:alkylhydroperoxidase family enzyme
MAYVSQNDYDGAEPEAKRIWDQQIRDHGRMTNMKRTLAHSPNALRAYMEWYPLKDEVAAFTGERAAILFAHAISVETDCLICSTFFRRILIEWEEDPDQLSMDKQEKLLVRYGVALARNPKKLPAKLMKKLLTLFSEKELVSLTAFGGIMIATNLFNDALQVELDEYLYAFR